MSLTVVTPPSAPAVTLVEAKAHLQVELADDDVLIADMVQAAEKIAEIATGRQLMTATYDWKLDGFARVMDVPRPPLQSVTSVKYEDSNGDEQTVDTAVYRVDTDTAPGRIILEPDQVWPTARLVENAVTVRMVCGYADSGASPAVPNDNVPELVKRWLMIQLANFYDNRNEYIQGLPLQSFDYVERALWGLKIKTFG